MYIESRGSFGQRVAFLFASFITLSFLSSACNPRPKTARDSAQLGTVSGPHIPEELQRLPETLRTLVVSVPITALPWIPETVEELDLPCSELLETSRIPPNVRRLVIGRAATSLLNRLPPKIESFSCSDLVGGIGEGFPARLGNVVDLTLGGAGLDRLESLPDGLIHFGLRNATSLSQLPPLPKGLVELSLDNSPITELPDLPTSLRTLRLRSTGVREVSNLPRDLDTLILDNNPNLYWLELPPFLRVLRYAETRIVGELPRLPPNLEQLEVAGVYIPRTARLPSWLESLRIGDQQRLRPRFPRRHDLLKFKVISTCLRNSPL